jgi:two-component system sensor histidine kinase FlrB
VVDSFAPTQIGSCLQLAIGNTNLQVRANRDAIKGALVNLVSNALQACNTTPRVELGAEVLGDRICLTVSDNGHGIPDEIRPRLFEAFFTTRPQGTGLGLAVVKAVVDAHDGEILIDSGASGTTIALCLPALGDRA